MNLNKKFECLKKLNVHNNMNVNENLSLVHKKNGIGLPDAACKISVKLKLMAELKPILGLVCLRFG